MKNREVNILHILYFYLAYLAYFCNFCHIFHFLHILRILRILHIFHTAHIFHSLHNLQIVGTLLKVKHSAIWACWGAFILKSVNSYQVWSCEGVSNRITFIQYTNTIYIQIELQCTNTKSTFVSLVHLQVKLLQASSPFPGSHKDWRETANVQRFLCFCKKRGHCYNNNGIQGLEKHNAPTSSHWCRGCSHPKTSRCTSFSGGFSIPTFFTF